ncbi:hypothetical protein ALP66_04211 [Pseudomonas amygdali pv. photiniae]|uniref:Uncharacterized protein n=6 Tax=Pseudomonas syringae group TaxID=136849 RepID=A0A0Q0BL48_PSEAJ|nr:Uncharacterized protein ALO79_03581 [Pseudomonas syringae pv. castaneae]KPX14836.1 Uncharacterized protein ALO71_02626 [Pseudomonas amygdali pv. dendropanacis]KPX75068.1 Uncharacterized protein ALO53_03660 [Pseudomonas amygdali pv. photiniae]KPY75806.1 Uncharacterized protein ALO60_04143 [Pseudomonas amygdali pv. tabaci]RMM62806.1 hypothetical protein ALQ73_200035 [Pseudomonas savastanoi pv. glycinea]RMS91721.1 hypothetical protein ALP58_02363 [Pseudomonas savastanoi]
MLKHIIHAFQWFWRLVLSIVASQLVRWALRNALDWLE